RQVCAKSLAWTTALTCTAWKISVIGEHTCIRQCTTGAEKGGGDVCGTQECDRTASPALTSDEVRSGAVLPCSGGPEPQATGAFPQPTDDTHWGSNRLTEVSEENGDTRSRKETRLTPFFNTHALISTVTQTGDSFLSPKLPEREHRG